MTPQTSPADKPAPRGMIAILAVTGFASAFALRISDPMIPVIARDFGSDAATTALLASAFALPYALVQPILGPVGDAVGKERVMKIALASLGAALIACAFAPNFTSLFALRILSGMTAGGIIPLALATIGDRTDMSRRQVGISRFLLGTFFGLIGGASLAGFLVELFGWRGVFVLAGLVSLAAWAAVYAGFRTPFAPPTAFRPTLAFARYREIAAMPRARALCAFVFTEGIIIFGIFPFIAPLLEAQGAGGPSEAGIILAGFAVGGLIYVAFVGLLLRTLGVRRMLMAAGLIAAAGMMGIALARPWLVDAAAMVALGIGFYMLHNSFQTQMTEVAPGSRGSAVSLHAFSYFTGQSLGPVVVGAGLASLGPVPTFALCALGCVVLGLIAAAVLAPRQPLAR